MPYWETGGARLSRLVRQDAAELLLVDRAAVVGVVPLEGCFVRLPLVAGQPGGQVPEVFAVRGLLLGPVACQLSERSLSPLAGHPGSCLNTMLCRLRAFF